MPSVRDWRATVTQLHPEHLFDKLEIGGLSAIERRQLHAHAAECTVCRFELLVREDLASEVLQQR